MRKVKVYTIAGNVKRATKRGYVWRQGYAEGETCQPWRTKREAQSEAKAQGMKAVFVAPGESWKLTGACPDCGKRATIKGRCLACGWRCTNPGEIKYV